MEPVLHIEGLTLSYGARPALQGISFSVGRGEVFGLLGPNGGGKTTLFRILSTLLPHDGGSVRILGHDLAADPDAVRAHIGVVFQSPSLDGHLTVEENLRYQGGFYGMRGPALAQAIAELLDRFGLAARAREKAGILSGGLRRRVEIAKALLHRPEVLLLDEPSTGLDPGVRRDLGDLLQSLGHDLQVTVLLTTHILEEADRCDRLAILDGGRIVAQGTPAELRAAVGGEVVTIGARDPEVLAADVLSALGLEARVVEGSLRIETPRGHDLVPALFEKFPGRIESVTVGRPTLEDVFVQRTGHRFERGDAA